MMFDRAAVPVRAMAIVPNPRDGRRTGARRRREIRSSDTPADLLERPITRITRPRPAAVPPPRRRLLRTRVRAASREV